MYPPNVEVVLRTGLYNHCPICKCNKNTVYAPKYFNRPMWSICYNCGYSRPEVIQSLINRPAFVKRYGIAVIKNYYCQKCKQISLCYSDNSWLCTTCGSGRLLNK